MEILKEYFIDACKKRTKELEERYDKNRKIRYTWQDRLEDALKTDEKTDNK